MYKKAFALFAVLLTGSFLYSQAAQSYFDGKTWWDYVKVLADDNMQGRDTGSPGLKRAEAFVVEQLKNNGLQPAGENGF